MKRAARAATARRFAGLAAAAMLSLTLAACGFKPLYGSNPGGNAARGGLGTIAIPAIGSERVGQQLRNALIDEITPGGQPSAPAYSLEIGLNASEADMLVQQNATVLRRMYNLRADYRLIDVSTGLEVFRAQASRAASFNRSDSEYANVIAKRDAEARAAEAIAQAIADRLGVYLASTTQPAPKPTAAYTPPAAAAPAPAPEPVAERSGRFPAPEAIDPSELN